jgi:hypothetical protein
VNVLFRSTLLLAMLPIFTAAMSIEEYAAKAVDEKVKVLRGKPERSLDDPRQLLRLYTISLRDPSPEVREAAAQSAAFLAMGLESAQANGKAPTFSTADSAAFQQALVSLLNQDNASIRASAASALAYSASPNATIENLLLDRVEAEPVPEIKASIVEAMAQAGYKSPRFVREATALIQPGADSKVIYSASKALAHLRPESALDTLIALASKVSPSQQHALQALAAYGQAAARAIPMLESLVNDQAMPEDIRNLARITLKAIKSGKPKASNLEPLSVVNPWPVDLAASSPPAQSTPAPEKAPASSPPPEIAIPASTSPTTPSASTGAASTERRAPAWAWVVGLPVLILLVAFFVKRRG